MKQIATIILTFLTITTFAQSKGYKYSMLDDSYELEAKSFKSHNLNGKIKSVMIYKKANSNYDSSNLPVNLSPKLMNAHKFFIESNQLVETQFINESGAVGSINIFSNGLIKKMIFYGSSKTIQYQDTFYYNQSNKIVKTVRVDKAGKIRSYITYAYNSKGQLDSVVDLGSINYKYIYDEFGGVYDITYYHKNNRDSIRDVIYHRSSDTEELTINIQKEQNIKFENVAHLKKKSQYLIRMDSHHRVVSEEQKNLVSGVVTMEMLYTYQNDLLVKKTFTTDYGAGNVHTYAYKGNKLVREISKDKNGVEVFKQELQYNAHGDIIKKHEKDRDKDEVHKYEYTYDHSNNWTEKKDIINGKLFEITYRDIVYEK